MRYTALCVALATAGVASPLAHAADPRARPGNAQNLQAVQQRYQELVSNPVIELDGKQLSCRDLGRLGQQAHTDHLNRVGTRPLYEVEPSFVANIVSAVTTCANMASALLPPPAALDYGSRSNIEEVARILEQARKWAVEVPEWQRAAIQQHGETLAKEKEAKDVAQLAEDKAAAERANLARKQADASRKAYEADAAKWNANYEQVRALPWMKRVEEPNPNQNGAVISDRQRALDHAIAAVNTKAWKEMTSSHPDMRDLPIQTDAAEALVQTVGSLMACAEVLTTDYPNDPRRFGLQNAVITFSPPLIRVAGRYDITIAGTMGPGQKPYSWTVYLKKMDGYFYADEVEEKGVNLQVGQLTNSVVGGIGFLTDACR